MSDVGKVTALIFMKHHSERVPRKNMRSFCGKPLFHWILETLNESRHIGEIIINTDSDEIAESASKHFRVTLHMRPDHLLTINSNEANQLIEHDVLNHDGNVYLQTHSTNPLLSVENIDRAVDAFLSQSVHDSLMSVNSIRKRFYWPDGRPVNHDPDHLVKTQDLTPIFEENSCIYMFTRETFLRRRSRIGENPMFFPIDSIVAVDIDEESDFQMAEALMRLKLESTS
jgi:N-acylneuraminate cytidylyltransferase